MQQGAATNRTRNDQPRTSINRLHSCKQVGLLARARARRPCLRLPNQRRWPRMPPCPVGHFGPRCGLNQSSLFPDHDVYRNFEASKDFRPQSQLTGWGPKSSFYSRIVNATRPELIVEVGVWKGSSTVHLAKAQQAYVGGGAVLAVDTFLGAIEFWNRRVTGGRYDATRDLEWVHGFPHVYYSFLSNVVKAGQSERVIPFPATSRMAARLLRAMRVQVEMVHLDAAHEYAMVNDDLAAWWPLVRPGGVLLGDDFTPFWPGVVRAACEFARAYQLRLHTNLSPREGAGKWWAFKPLTHRAATKPGRSPAPLPPGEPQPHPHAECLQMNVSRVPWR